MSTRWYTGDGREATGLVDAQVVAEEERVRYL